MSEQHHEILLNEGKNENGDKMAAAQLKREKEQTAQDLKKIFDRLSD